MQIVPQFNKETTIIAMSDLGPFDTLATGHTNLLPLDLSSDPPLEVESVRGPNGIGQVEEVATTIMGNCVIRIP